MITKERLKELIEQGATIFITTSTGIQKENLSKENNIGKDNTLYWRDMGIAELEYLFETEEDARWELEMTATYQDTLRLANYIDFENENGDRVFYHKGATYELSLWWAIDGTKIIRVIWRGNDGFDCLFEKPLTKENYIEACKLCLRLFRGEEV